MYVAGFMMFYSIVCALMYMLQICLTLAFTVSCMSLLHKMPYLLFSGVSVYVKYNTYLM